MTAERVDLIPLNLKLLFSAGVVPTSDIRSSIWKLRVYRIYPMFMSFLYSMVLTAQCLAIYKYWGHLDVITDIGFTMVGIFMCYVMAGYAIKNTERILQLIKMLETELPTIEEPVKEAVRKSRIFTYIMFFLVHGMLSTWIAAPILLRYAQDEKEEPETDEPYPYFCFVIWLPFDATQSPGYELVYTVQTLCFLMASLYYTSINTLFITFIIHVAAQFQILVQSLKCLDDHPHDEYFINCIKHHQTIIKFSKELDLVLSPLLFFFFCCSQMIMCVVTFQVVLTWADGTIQVKLILGLMAALCGPLMFCWFGTVMIQEGLAVEQAVYDCKWYERPTNFRRLLGMVLMRSQKPVRLTAGQFYDVSLTSFTQMLNAVYTYFAVLKQLYDE
ncbi:Odorant receptor 36 [Blattella germanica]|nr:Odorant receptor 36 [Blattella germanica]